MFGCFISYCLNCYEATVNSAIWLSQASRMAPTLKCEKCGQRGFGIERCQSKEEAERGLPHYKKRHVEFLKRSVRRYAVRFVRPRKYPMGDVL